jgi:cytochrome c oxidase assembly factor CtaG
VDVSSAIVIVLLAVGYGWCFRRARLHGHPVQRGSAWCFYIGIGLWLLATMSVIGAYAYVLFWMRALQVLLLLLIVPFFVAAGKPLTVLRAALSETGRTRFDRVLGSRWARVLAHPATTSIAMLTTPWLLYLTPWYTAALEHQSVGALTRIALVAIGFGYFYSRLQADPVPQRFSQLISLVISIFETIGDGILGLVLWLGPLIATAYYVGLHRSWGPSMRVDQSVGAGVLWILGDVLGIPFLMVLVRALSADERARAVEVDAELDRIEEAEPERPSESTLWWENDPQLRDRFRRQ